MKTIVVASTKGGVGKTTCSVNIARKLAMKYKVGILDGDLTSPSVCKILNAPLTKIKIGKDKVYPIYYNDIKIFSTSLVSGSEDIPILFKGEKKRSAMIQFINKVNWGDLDYLIIDAAPGCSDELIEILDVYKDDIYGMIIITTPSRLSVNSVRKLVSLCSKKYINILGLIANMYGLVCPHCNNKINALGSWDLVDNMIKEFNLKLLAGIPLIPEVEVKPMKIIEYFKFAEGGL